MDLAQFHADPAIDYAARAVLPDDFYRHVLADNPFLVNRAVLGEAGLWLAADVASIHEAAFARFTELAADASRLQRGLGALLVGESGTGKSHLLARLARWASAGARGYVIPVRQLQTAPAGVPAAVLRSAAAELTGKPGGRAVDTPLFQLVRAAARAAVGDDRGHYSWTQLGKAFARMADRLTPSLRYSQAGRTTFDLFYRFFRSATRAAARKEDGLVASLVRLWLCGGVLDATQARWLNLPLGRHRDDPVTLSDPEWVKQTLAALAALTTATGRPFVLVVDQAEALDVEQFAALARFLEGLLDAAPGLLVVTAADPAVLSRWRKASEAPASAWDRLGQFEVAVGRLTEPEALALVYGRLDGALARFGGSTALTAIRRDAPLFPLRSPRWPAAARAREVLDAARGAWTTEQEELRRVGGAAWHAGWSAPAGAPAAVLRVGDETSLTLEQVQAAMVRATAKPAVDANGTASLSVEEIQASLLTLQGAGAPEAGAPTTARFQPAPLTRTDFDLSACVEPSGPDLAELASECAEGEGLADCKLQLATCNLQLESAIDTDAASQPAREIDAAPPFDPAETPVPSPAALPPASEQAEFPDPPTLPDPQAIRPQRVREAAPSVQLPANPQAAPLLAPTAIVYAPTTMRVVPVPRAWPQLPSCQPLTPREEAVDQVVAEALAAYLAAQPLRRELNADAEQIAELLLGILNQCRVADSGYGVLQVECVPAWKAAPPACDLIVRQWAAGDVVLRTGILVLTASRAAAMASFLRRLATEVQPFDRLFLITEERQGLPMGPRGMEYLDELQERTAIALFTLELTQADYLGLAALRAVVRQARADALTAAGERILESDAIASHHRQQRYQAARCVAAILFDAPSSELRRKMAAPV